MWRAISTCSSMSGIQRALSFPLRSRKNLETQNLGFERSVK